MPAHETVGRAGAAGAARGGVGLVCLTGIAWGTAPIAFSYAHDGTGLSSFAISAHRLGIAALTLFAVTLLRRQIQSAWRAVRSRPGLIVCLGVGVGAYQVLWFAAIPHVGASAATVLSLGLAPVLVTAWEKCRSRSLPRTMELAVLAAGVLGLVLVSFSAGHGSTTATGNTGLGITLAVSAGVVYAATTVLSRHLATRCEPLPLTTATTAVGAVAVLPVAALAGPLIVADPTTIAALLYLGVVTMALGYLVLYVGLRYTSASTAAIATLLEPVTATVLAVVLLGERLPAAGGSGIVLILGAVLALNVRTESRRPPEVPNDNEFL